MLCSNFDHVVQIGYGKSGTSTVRNYFEKLGYNSSCPTLKDFKVSLSENTWPLFESIKKCKHMYVSELAHIYFPGDNFHLQLTHMNIIRMHMPQNTLYVHCQRNSSRWMTSVQNWNNLFHRFVERDIIGLPIGYPRNKYDLIEWYESVNSYLKMVFKNRNNYINVDIENPKSVKKLENLCNFKNEWKKVNKNMRYKHI